MIPDCVNTHHPLGSFAILWYFPNPPTRSSHFTFTESKRRSKLYVLQLLLAMAVASDDAVDALRATPGLQDAVLAASSYGREEKVRHWLRPQSILNRLRKKPNVVETDFRALDELTQQIQGTANQVLASLGYNQWRPKMPGQKGLRILCLDGGGTRGVVAISAMKAVVEAMGGTEVCDAFDIIAGTSTGAIIAFLVGLRRESSQQASERYDTLIKKIFIKSALSTPMMMFTTAGYDDGPFMDVLRGILKDTTMLDSRYDPSVPLVFGVTSVMSSTPTHVLLYRNYNYCGGEMPDKFTIDPDQARQDLGLESEFPQSHPKSDRHQMYQEPWIVGEQLHQHGSRHPGSFRVLQRYALRSSAAAPTFFKPVQMGGATFADGGVVASNPTGVAVHEAKVLFPGVPIELVVSIGTGGMSIMLHVCVCVCVCATVYSDAGRVHHVLVRIVLTSFFRFCLSSCIATAASEDKTNPTVGWKGIIGQIVNSALDCK